MEDLEEVYDENSKLVFKYVFCLVRNESVAEEITQETFLVAAKNINEYNGKGSPTVWLCQIARNLCNKYFKEQARKKSISLEDAEVYSNELEDNVAEKDMSQQVLKLINQEDEDIREIMYLRLIGNLSFAEIAKITNKSENWARVNFYRTKDKIANEMQDKI